MRHDESDQELLERWAAGNRKAGEVLFDRHIGQLRSFLRRKVVSGADDLVQQVFLGCLEGHGRIRSGGSFRSYLFGIARNVVSDHYRSLHRHVHYDLEMTSQVIDEPELAAKPADDVNNRVLHDALRQLTRDQQLLLKWTYWGGLSVVEVADALGIGVNTAYTRLRRARLRLEGILRELSPDLAPGPVERRVATE
ncbi:MAG: sigma-70 family RNA polymerase sigma factor [Myxococcales bacterium]|nr:sigma-70 family RNA polymerase sigma factor [Myxococcales bacterium]